jgi:hypothetical protein
MEGYLVRRFAKEQKDDTGSRAFSPPALGLIFLPTTILDPSERKKTF